MEVKDMALGVVTNAISRHPRSLQKRIGPSEIGKPCDRWMLHKLNGDEEPPRGPAWKPAVGTALHSQMEEWFDAANIPNEHGDVTNTEWVTENRVTVGKIGDQVITGSADLFHVPTGTVIDFKFIGDRQLAHYRLNGPSDQYRVQAMLYGKGFTDDGGWGPARKVAIWFIPRNAELHQAYWWEADYDPHVAAEALLRANRLWSLLQVVGVDKALATAPLCDDQWCSWCKAEKRAEQAAGRRSLFGDDFPETVAAAAPLAPVTALRSTTCTVCHSPLHASVLADGATTHPTCDPELPADSAPGIPSTPQPAGAGLFK